MACRPAWTVQNGKVISRSFDFTWSSGFAVCQKQKNITALHNAIKEETLEISTKGKVEAGVKLSAFNLMLDGVYVENIYQASKKYEMGGPYTDLLNVSPKDAKRDERHKNSGSLVAYVYKDTIWSVPPETAFYDFIYISALRDTFGDNYDLSKYSWFTDIEFNPKKSINCQARAVAVYKLMQATDSFSVMNNMKSWTDFHQKHVAG